MSIESADKKEDSATHSIQKGEVVEVPIEMAERLARAALATADFSLLQLGGFDPPEPSPMKYDDAVQLSVDARTLRGALNTHRGSK